MDSTTKIIFGPLLILIAVLSACINHEISSGEMISEMKAIRSDSNSIMSILWYQGSDQEFDYFAYVFSMTGTKKYKVPIGQFVLPRMELTDDSSNWIRINEIKAEWSASRLYDGIWIEDREGVSIEVMGKQ